MSGPFLPQNHISFIFISTMIELVVEEQNRVQAKLSAIRKAKSSISIADMFEMQMRMNKLSQFTEMSSSIISASNQAIRSLTSGTKGQ